MTEQKALEVLISWLRLAYHNADGTDESSAELYEALQTTFKLITRQQAEIERLKEYNENLQTANTALSNEILDIKSEAVKEFAERLKETKFKHDNDYIVYAENIDVLVKEMVGEK